MSVRGGSKSIVGKGLVFCVDAKSKQSYPGSGTSLTDVIGNATGTISGATFTNNTFSYDGTDDTINMGNILHFADTDSWTVCGWVYLDDTGNWQNFIGDRLNSGNYNGWNIYATSTSARVQVYIKNAGGDEIRSYGSTGLSATTWIHLTVSYDGSTNASGVKFYQNGVADTANTISDNLSNWSGNTGNLYIGSRGGGSDWFDGDHGPIVAYNRVLSAAEILQNFNAHRGRFGV
tara:strand:- start:1505 stop:2203 length:699 start_codon:yes stop_codon:yes gene_type:complete